MTLKSDTFIRDYLSNFIYGEKKTLINYQKIDNEEYPVFTNEYWTAKQKQGNSLHQIAYRGCFKSQLPAFFINLLTEPKDTVYDPFSGRGTTVIEGGLSGRNIIANDINPLSKILSYARFFIPTIKEVEKRLEEIPFEKNIKADIDLSMFYHNDTESEIVSIKNYLKKKHDENSEDKIDSWIRMIATNRLTGHSSGFFSVYTLPPNQAVSQKSQEKINKKRNQIPEYRNTKKIILKKTKNLTHNLTETEINNLNKAGEKAIFLTEDGRQTKIIKDNSICLTVTSPPFLNVVQYSNDNWLRWWFNSIDSEKTRKKIIITPKIEDWCDFIGDIFKELYRITKNEGYVAFEVGEVNEGKIKLEEYIVPIGISTGFFCEGIMINQQVFTKTANIWGIKNNNKGTNTNRIVIFKKNNYK